MRMKPYPEKDGKRVWLSTSEIQQLIDEAENTEQEIAIKLAAQCGLRRNEITSVTPADVVTDEHGATRVRIWEDVAKHEHYREPPIPSSVSDKIEAAVDYQNIADSEPIIDVADKTVYRWVRRATERLESKTGDEGWSRVDVHDLRRSWGTHILEEGVLASVVMEWGGWKDWDTFRKHYLGEFSPKVLERERQKVDYYSDGDPIDADPIGESMAPPSSSSHYADD